VITPRGAPLALVIVMLVIFALDVPVVIAVHLAAQREN
jgi:hypothetical protein